jgi:SAM-dependent methyltransferase
MQFYPSLNLYKAYLKNTPKSDFFSQRIPDRTTRNSLNNLNRAMNICVRNQVFLDFGAGNGRYSVTLLPEFEKGYGTEIEKSLLLSQIAKKDPKYKALFGEDAILKIKDKVDLVILMDVIEHIPVKKMSELVNRIARVQAEGGVVYISTPNALRCGIVEKSGIYYKRFPHGHHKHYLASELITQFAKKGYRPIFSCYEDFPLRLFVKKIIGAVSTIDKKLSKIQGYTFLTWPLIWIANGLFTLIEPVVSWDEYKRSNDSFSSQTLLLALKK